MSGKCPNFAKNAAHIDPAKGGRNIFIIYQLFRVDSDLVTLKEKFDCESLKRLYLGNTPLIGDEGKPVLPVIPAQFIIPVWTSAAQYFMFQ